MYKTHKVTFCRNDIKLTGFYFPEIHQLVDKG